eukprot:452602-Prymnesium_polylepis.1
MDQSDRAAGAEEHAAQRGSGGIADRCRREAYARCAQQWRSDRRGSASCGGGGGGRPDSM